MLVLLGVLQVVANESLVDMLWANGTFGLSLGVNMDSGTVGGDDAETTMDIGVGMNVAGYDVLVFTWELQTVLI